MNLIADSVTPLVAIPAAFRVQRNRGALLYADGDYVADSGVAHTFPRREWISTRRHYAGQARLARFLDSERFDAQPEDFPPFRLEREHLIDQGEVHGYPGIYCSIDPGDGFGVKAVIAACRQADQPLPYHWWIAWYTSGGFAPDAQQVADEIYRLTREHIYASDIYACQFATGAYDLSVVYQTPAWDPRA